MQEAILGFDIGGSKIHAVIWKNSRVAKMFQQKTPKNKKDFVEILKKIFEKAQRHSHIIGVGIGCAGVLTDVSVVFSPNIPYLKNFKIKKIFPRSTKVSLENDARSFLRAEAFHLPNIDREDKILGLTIGTGIGRTFWEAREIVPVKKFEYAEAWEKEYQKIPYRHTDRKLTRFLATHLTPIINMYSPKIIIVGGGVMRHTGFFTDFENDVHRKIKSVKILRSYFKDSAVAVGGALLVLNSF